MWSLLLAASAFSVTNANSATEINFEFGGMLDGLSGSDHGRSTGSSDYSPRTREYYVAAVEVDWDYAPSGKNQMEDRAFTEDELVFVGQSNHTIGSVYKKALYREYTDATFSTQVQISDTSMGMIGPVLRAVVGDEMHVHFKNLASVPYSMHPHGVFYDKASEGVPHTGGETGDDAVQPGDEWKYIWKVPSRAGPARSDPTSIIWMYHSHTDEVMDTNTGLVGPIVITSADWANDDGTPVDVDSEHFAFYSVVNENESHYLEENIAKYGVDAGADPDLFEEGNLMHAINGYVYGNLNYEMRFGTTARWYLFALGTEVDMHTPHWHGNTIRWHNNNMDVVNLLPATMLTADMFPDNRGTWMFHCHVNDHISAGMTATFTVE